MTIEIRIVRIGLAGQGVGYDAQGSIYFVPGAVPGDLVRVTYTETRKRYRDAELVAILDPSPDRRESPCPYFQKCGGCDFLHWDYAAQLRAKDAMLAHVLERAQWTPRQFLSILSAPETLGYRNRIQLRTEGDRLGFLRRHSHEIVDIEQCLVAHPSLNAEISRLRDKKEGSVGRKKIELSLNADGKVSWSVNSAHAAAGFTQVNARQNDALRGLVKAWLKEGQARQVLELFCGNGNLTYAYHPYVEKIVAVDSNAEAIALARASASPEMESKVAFHQALVGPALVRRLPETFVKSYDTLVLDPPRTGMERDLDRWVTPAVRNVLYVSCSPASLARDVTGLKKQFALARVQAVDMFPQTRHIELVAWFIREKM